MRTENRNKEKVAIGFVPISQCPRDTNKELEVLGNYFLVVCVLLTVTGGLSLNHTADRCLTVISE